MMTLLKNESNSTKRKALQETSNVLLDIADNLKQSTPTPDLNRANAGINAKLAKSKLTQLLKMPKTQPN